MNDYSYLIMLGLVLLLLLHNLHKYTKCQL